MFGEESVKAFQQYLHGKGYYTGKIDGIFGSGAKKALKKYQGVLQVKMTGIINLETAKAIKKDITQ